ncbi:MAG: methyltransferase domain-containing protein [Candidatus Tectomicrobia bacterium]|nr:methyltransferase domain-containing protein [Candidatus Tectomicrobia bacterium]
MPKVSVVMSVLNGEAYLAEAVGSILSQTFRDFEWVVLDDGSTDRTRDILAGFEDLRLRVIRQENRGLAASLNRAVAESCGEYVARMDADDFSYPNRFQNQVAFLDAHPEYALIGCYYHIVDAAGQLLGLQYRPVQNEDLQRALLHANQFAHGAVMFRRRAFDRAGGYDPQFRYAQDYDLWLRMADDFNLFNIPKALYAWRATRTNLSPAKVQEQLETARRIVERTRERRRRRVRRTYASADEYVRHQEEGSNLKGMMLRAAPHIQAAVADFCRYVGPAHRVLCVGIRDGHEVECLRGRGIEDVVGIELSPSTLALARERGVLGVRADMHHLPFPGAAFDAVFSRHSLEHSPSPEAALNEFRRVLRPGGHLYVIVPRESELGKYHGCLFPDREALGILLESVGGMNLLRLEERGLPPRGEPEFLAVARRPIPTRVFFTDPGNPMSDRLGEAFHRVRDARDAADIWYVRSDSLPPEAIAAKKREGARIVHNLAGVLFPAVDPQYRRSNAVLKQIQDELADFVIYQSEFARRACGEFLGPAPCPWEVVPNAVDETFFSPPARMERRNVLLTVGLHRHAQRFRAILNALPLVRREVPDVRLIIAGPVRAEGPGAVLGLIQERIAALDLSGCVELTGPVPQERLPDLYRSADVFLHPSSIDGCPKVVIEAMACGLPVAHALYGGTPELVGDAGVGAPVDAPSWERIPEIDPAEYAEAILKVLENEEDLSRRARERVLERFTLSRSVESHRRIFERTLAGPPRGDGVLRTRNPIFHHRFDPVQVPWVEFEGGRVMYPRAFLMDYTRRMAGRFAGRVLDVGAGKWTYPRSLFSHCWYRTLDVVPGENVDLVADLANLPFAEGSLDGVLCHQVLEHATDPFRAVREMHRVLRPGGWAMISTPFLYPVHEDGPVKDYWRFTERGLRELSRDFREVVIEGVGPENFPFCYCVLCRK